MVVYRIKDVWQGMVLVLRGAAEYGSWFQILLPGCESSWLTVDVSARDLGLEMMRATLGLRRGHGFPQHAGSAVLTME
jgi:hypothetical protein